VADLDGSPEREWGWTKYKILRAEFFALGVAISICVVPALGILFLMPQAWVFAVVLLFIPWFMATLMAAWWVWDGGEPRRVVRVARDQLSLRLGPRRVRNREGPAGIALASGAVPTE
jgi:hypothetical protein